MVRIYYRTFRTRGVYASIPAFRRTVFEGMRSEIALDLRKALRQRAMGWQHVPDFAFELRVEESGIYLHVFPKGWGAQYWTWVSRGVAGHTITRKVKYSKGWTKRSRKSGKYRAALSLYRYKPFTLPGGWFGGPGLRAFSGYRRTVEWPGIRPRHFEEYVAAEYNEQFRRKMENIVRRAIRAAQREGR